MLDQALDDLIATSERPQVIAEELRLLLRQRDQLSLQAARLAGDLARFNYGEKMGSISTPDWIRHECQLGYQAAADLVFVGLTMDALAASVAAVEESEIGFQHLVLIARTQHALSESAAWRQARQRPHLNVSATLGTLYQMPGSAAAELDHGDPVSGVTVGRIACDCSIRRHLFDPASVLVELGRQKRVVSPQLRKALEGRDRGCRWPGCNRPGSWCEAHHVVPWTRGGKTNLDNLVMLCNRHHVKVHEGRWQLLLQPDGRVEVLKPPLDFAAPPCGPATGTAA